MNLWEVAFEEHWDYTDNEEDFDVDTNYNVIAGSYDEAIEKARKVALAQTVDDFKCTAVRLISIHRGVEIDAL